MTVINSYIIKLMVSAASLFFMLEVDGAAIQSAQIKHPVLTKPGYQLSMRIDSYGQKLISATSKIMKINERTLINEIREVAEKISFVNQRAGKYADTANKLATLYAKTQNEDYAYRSGLIMYEIAKATENIYETDLNFLNAGSTIPPCVYAYDTIYNAKSWGRLPANAKQEIETWFKRVSWSLLRRLAKTPELHNMMPHAAQRGSGTALVLNDPELMRAWIAFVDRFVSSQYFLSDGVYLDFSYSYQYQVMNHLRPAMMNFKLFRDPPNYNDLKYGIKLNGHYDFNSRWPLFSAAAYVDDSMRLPDGRFIPVGDTSAVIKNLNGMILSKYSKCLAYNVFGQYSLSMNKNKDVSVAYLNVPPVISGMPYGGGHRHANSLSLIIWGAGNEMLTDFGYAHYRHGFSSGNKYFYHTLRSHNTAFAWDKNTEPYCNLLDKPSLARLIAYEDGSNTDGFIQVAAASSPGGGGPHVKLRQRLIAQIKIDDKNSYVFDNFKLQGGDIHEFYLVHNDEEQCELKIASGAETLSGSLQKYLGKPGRRDYNSYLEFFTNIQKIAGDNATNYEVVGTRTGNSVKVWLNAVPGLFNYWSTVPSLRRYVYDNERLKGKKRVHKFGEQRTIHLTRTRPVKPDELSDFSAIYEVVKKGAEKAVSKVDFSTQANYSYAIIKIGRFTDIIYLSNDTVPRKIINARFCGQFAFIRLDISNEPVFAYVRGNAFISGNNYSIASESQAIEARVTATGMVEYGAAENFIELAVPANKLKGHEGQWIYPLLGDKRGFGIKIKSIAKNANGRTKVILENSPSFVAGTNYSFPIIFGRSNYVAGAPVVEIIPAVFKYKKDLSPAGGTGYYRRMDFSQKKKSSEDTGKISFMKLLGWKVNQIADNDKAFSIRPRVNPFDKDRGSPDYLLQLWDLDPKGMPVVEFPFASELASGSINVAMGTAGVQCQGAVLYLCAGERELVKVILGNNKSGQVWRDRTKIQFNGSWFFAPKDFALEWANGKFSLYLEGKEICKDIKFTSPGVPDRVKFSVGYGSAVVRGLLIKKIIIKGK